MCGLLAPDVKAVAAQYRDPDPNSANAYDAAAAVASQLRGEKARAAYSGCLRALQSHTNRGN